MQQEEDWGRLPRNVGGDEGILKIAASLVLKIRTVGLKHVSEDICFYLGAS